MTPSPHPFTLSGQTALITGGGSGLGLGMARCFIAAGARVALVGRRRAELDAAVRELGPQAHAIVGDVTDLPSLPALVAQVESTLGDITVLVNNAGNHLKKPATDTTDAEFAAVIETHVFGAFALTREVGKRMIQRRAGSILFTTSMSAFMGIPLIVAYTTAKTAYVGMVRSLANEWGPHNVRVNAIAPGWIASPMLEQALNGDPARKAKIMGRIPLGGFGTPEQIGLAAVYLSSPAAAYITGVVLPVDGGAAEAF